MADFFVRDKSGERGPFTRSQLRSMWDSGFVTSDSEARMEDTADWVPMSALIEQVDASPIQTDVPSVPTKTRTKPWSLLVTVPLLFAVIAGNVHVITGGGVGFRVVMRDSLSFSEFFVNVDSITSMPWIAAKSRFPIGCRILQREGLIESDAEFEVRRQKETQKRIEDMERDLKRSRSY